MRRRSLLVPLLIALACAPLRADIPPPPGTPARDTSPTLTFVNLKDFPNHNFFLKYCHGGGAPWGSPWLTPVPVNGPARLQGKYHLTEVFLLAVPRDMPTPKTATDQDWLYRPIPGTLLSNKLPGAPGEDSVYMGVEEVALRYRVSMKGGKLDVKRIDKDGGAPASPAPREPLRQGFGALGLLLSAVVFALGVRRPRRTSRE